MKQSFIWPKLTKYFVSIISLINVEGTFQIMGLKLSWKLLCNNDHRGVGILCSLCATSVMYFLMRDLYLCELKADDRKHFKGLDIFKNFSHLVKTKQRTYYREKPVIYRSTPKSSIVLVLKTWSIHLFMVGKFPQNSDIYNTHKWKLSYCIKYINIFHKSNQVSLTAKWFY